MHTYTESTKRQFIQTIFAAALDDAATDSTIDDCIADINDLLNADELDTATADDFILALHRIAELE